MEADPHNARSAAKPYREGGPGVVGAELMEGFLEVLLDVLQHEDATVAVVVLLWYFGPLLRHRLLVELDRHLRFPPRSPLQSEIAAQEKEDKKISNMSGRHENGNKTAKQVLVGSEHSPLQAEIGAHDECET